MKDHWKCRFGMHKYTTYDEITIKDIEGKDIERIIILQCERDCGRFFEKRISLKPRADNY